MYPVNLPEVMIGKASDKFDTNGNLTDESANKLIAELLKNLGVDAAAGEVAHVAAKSKDRPISQRERNLRHKI